MKNKKFILVVLAVVLSIAFIYLVSSYEEEKDISNSKVVSKVKRIMDSMTLEEKIGQMLVINVNGTSLDDEYLSMFNEIKPGGIILMGDNFSTFNDTKMMIKKLKSESRFPLIVSVDQEGGRVQRLKNLTDVSSTNIPDMYSLGETEDVSLAYDVGKVMALELRTLGFNVVNAPVLDIYSNKENTVIGNRSFGSNYKIVSKMAISLADGLESNGIIATYKHFPGHGDTNVDSHISLPVINKSYDEVKNMELIPFRDAIKNGAKIIMTAHIVFPNLTGDNTPASLSKEILTNILREDLNYNGLIITDALNMKSLINNYTNEEIYVKAILAGVDLLLMPKDLDNIINIIKDNVDEDRINESVKRILEFKYMYLDKDNSLDITFLGKDEYKDIINRT